MVGLDWHCKVIDGFIAFIFVSFGLVISLVLFFKSVLSSLERCSYFGLM